MKCRIAQRNLGEVGRSIFYTYKVFKTSQEKNVRLSVISFFSCSRYNAPMVASLERTQKRMPLQSLTQICFHSKHLYTHRIFQFAYLKRKEVSCKFVIELLDN